MSLTLDAGALIALERGSPRIRALLGDATRRGEAVLVPAGVVAQVWRSPRQVRLARLLRSPDITIVALDGESARAVGSLLASSNTADTVDGHVALVARGSDSAVVTSDPDDLRRLDSRLVLHEV